MQIKREKGFSKQFIKSTLWKKQKSPQKSPSLAKQFSKLWGGPFPTKFRRFTSHARSKLVDQRGDPCHGAAEELSAGRSLDATIPRLFRSVWFDLVHQKFLKSIGISSGVSFYVINVDMISSISFQIMVSIPLIDELLSSLTVLMLEICEAWELDGLCCPAFSTMVKRYHVFFLFVRPGLMQLKFSKLSTSLS